MSDVTVPRPHWLSTIAGQPVSPPLPRSVNDLIAARADDVFRRLNVDLPTGVLSATVMIGRIGSREVNVTIHRPEAEAEAEASHALLPVLLYIHGGAWHTGSAEDDRKLLMSIAATGVVVVAPDYALAPESPYPAALEDCVFTARWIADEIETHHGSPDRLTIGGASAGANLAAATLLHLHSGVGKGALETGGRTREVSASSALFLYGVFDIPDWLADPADFAGTLEWVLAAYLGLNWTTQIRDPLISPLRADLSGFPPSYVSCGDEDSFLSQSLDFIGELATAGVPATASVVAGGNHAFLNVPGTLPEGPSEVARIGDWLKSRPSVRYTKPHDK